jgi:hypothetical protein
MRKLIALLLALLFCLSLGALAKDKEVDDLAVPAPLNVGIKQLRSAPFEDADLVYQIPIDVSLLDISLDGNWYKVKITYNLGFLSYTYVGWANIPVGQIMSDREKHPTEIAFLEN